MVRATVADNTSEFMTAWIVIFRQDPIILRDFSMPGILTLSV